MNWNRALVDEVDLRTGTPQRGRTLSRGRAVPRVASGAGAQLSDAQTEAEDDEVPLRRRRTRRANRRGRGAGDSSGGSLADGAARGSQARQDGVNLRSRSAVMRRPERTPDGSREAANRSPSTTRRNPPTPPAAPPPDNSTRDRSRDSPRGQRQKGSGKARRGQGTDGQGRGGARADGRGRKGKGKGRATGR